MTGVPGMDGNELAEWKQLYSRYLFGPVGEGIRFWRLARYICAANGVKPLPKFTDFLPYFSAKQLAKRSDETDFAAIAAASGIPFVPGSELKSGPD